MYNQEIMDANDIVVPEQPTWEQIAEIAEQVHTDDVAGICLRGRSGWRDLGFPLTTVVNTFGGTWWGIQRGRHARASPASNTLAFPNSKTSVDDALRKYRPLSPGKSPLIWHSTRAR